MCGFGGGDGRREVWPETRPVPRACQVRSGQVLEEQAKMTFVFGVEDDGRGARYSR